MSAIRIRRVIERSRGQEWGERGWGWGQRNECKGSRAAG